MVQAFGATISGTVLLDKRKLWLVDGCLEYRQPIITNASPPKRPKTYCTQSLYPFFSEFPKYRLRSQQKRLGGVSSQRNYVSASLDEVKLKNLVLWTDTIKKITTVKSYRSLYGVKLNNRSFENLKFRVWNNGSMYRLRAGSLFP